MEGYIAEIRMFAGNFAPRNWAYCNGQLLSIAQNTALFSLLGTTFGGNGQTTFGLPNSQSRVMVGTGTGPGLPAVTLGEVGGVETVTLNTTQMPSHTHTVTTSGSPAAMVSSAQASMSAPAANSAVAAPGTLSGRSFTATLGFNTSAPDVQLSMASVNTSGVTYTNTVAGSNQPHSNIQPYLGMSYIICLYGIFPSRN